MKKHITLLVILFLIISAVAFALIYRKNHSGTTAGASAEASGIVLFYSNSCPHCQKVEQYIKDNNVSEKVKFEQKEVSGDQKNSDLLVQEAESCGISYDQIGVPLLWTGSKCVVGDQDIIAFFRDQLKNSSN